MITVATLFKAALVAAVFASGALIEHWRGAGVMARQDLKHQQETAQAAEEARQQADAVTEVYRLRARAYEAWKAAQRPRAIAIHREIQNELQANRSWSDQPLPAGVRRALERAAVEHGAAEPDPAMRGVRDAIPANER